MKLENVNFRNYQTNVLAMNANNKEKKPAEAQKAVTVPNYSVSFGMAAKQISDVNKALIGVVEDKAQLINKIVEDVTSSTERLRQNSDDFVNSLSILAEKGNEQDLEHFVDKLSFKKLKEADLKINLNPLTQDNKLHKFASTSYIYTVGKALYETLEQMGAKTRDFALIWSEKRNNYSNFSFLDYSKDYPYISKEKMDPKNIELLNNFYDYVTGQRSYDSFAYRHKSVAFCRLMDKLIESGDKKIADYLVQITTNSKLKDYYFSSYAHNYRLGHLDDKALAHFDCANGYDNPSIGAVIKNTVSKLGGDTKKLDEYYKMDTGELKYIQQQEEADLEAVEAARNKVFGQTIAKMLNENPIEKGLAEERIHQRRRAERNLDNTGNGINERGLAWALNKAR